MFVLSATLAGQQARCLCPRKPVMDDLSSKRQRALRVATSRRRMKKLKSLWQWLDDDERRSSLRVADFQRAGAELACMARHFLEPRPSNRDLYNKKENCCLWAIQPPDQLTSCFRYMRAKYRRANFKGTVKIRVVLQGPRVCIECWTRGLGSTDVITRVR